MITSGKSPKAGLKSTSMVSAMILLLGACASNYEAPIDDRSANLERQAPVILSSGQTVPSGGQQAAQPVIADRTANTGSGPVGATATVVRPVNVGGGIRRARIDDSNAAATTSPGPGSSSSSTNTSTSIHTVTRGDTLYSIAWTYNLDVRTLAVANSLVAPYTIYPGQRLLVSETEISASALSSVPAIPASPAGESVAVASGQRPQAAIDARRTGSIATRQVDGVSWQWPADGRLLSTFSETGSSRGIDIGGRQGEAVFSAADGDVVYAGSGIQGAGNLVILRHSARHLSAYMHNSTVLVGEGDRVRAGDKIAEMGTGAGGRDMLHFEVRVDGKPVDPVRYLPGR
tara:strand:- start:49520 stop:50554 length:1035 start_codon:yes stop_codon:yes gene_type:complete